MNNIQTGDLTKCLDKARNLMKEESYTHNNLIRKIFNLDPTVVDMRLKDRVKEYAKKKYAGLIYDEQDFYERHLNTYYILRRSSSAIKVKLADRISNMERSIDNSYAKVYAKEYTAFKFSLYDGNNLDMWRELDAIYDKLKAE